MSLVLPELALSIKQPWASLIACGAKDIENRDWFTRVRGRVAIHSSAKMDREEMESACDLMESFIPKFNRRIFERDNFPLGCIIGAVDITDCVRSSDSPWFFGEFGFVLANARQLPTPIKCRGALGFWRIPEELRRIAA